MDFADVIHNQVKADRTKRLKESPQITLGELIVALDGVEKKDLKVYFDFEYAYPAGLSSWRGSYDELALKFSFEGEAPTVESLLAKLKDAVGKEYTGYKGGEFRMDKHTPIWAANYGNSGNTAIVGIINNGYSIILKTEYCEY